MPANAKQQVDLLGILEVLHAHLDRSLCESAWSRVRVHERQAKWSLDLLVQFWVAVTLAPPPSLRQALAQAQGIPEDMYPAPEATPAAFFARSQSLRWEFFEEVFRGFQERALKGLEPCFAAELEPIASRFTQLLAVDGSGLDAVARRLKVLWGKSEVPLPGSLLALYDIRRGVLAHLDFDVRANAAEFPRATALLARLPAEALVVGDRLYGVPKLFAALGEHKLFGISRRFGPVRLEKRQQVSSLVTSEGEVEDYDVLAGTPQRTHQQLRQIRLVRRGKVVLELFTNVLDRERLSALEALTLYRHRWTVERLFSDLKEVLNLNRFYGANTNAAGMQVFATAIVHTAMRIAQARIAQQAEIAPEAISTKKLFPKVAVLCAHLSGARQALEQVRALNPGRNLKMPTLRSLPFATIELSTILVEQGRATRRPRRRYKPRGEWRSLPRRKSPPTR
jgi:hypothetical protein